MVTVAVVIAGLACLLLDIFFAVNRFGVHGSECLEAVTTVDIQNLCHRAKAMGSIHVTTVFHVVLHAPSQFVGVVFGVAPVVSPEVIKIVDICTLGTKYFTEYSVLGHVESVEFKPVIAAVFQNHAVLAVLL